MQVGTKRTFIARIAGALGFVCGVIGLLAGLTAHTWKLGAIKRHKLPTNTSDSRPRSAIECDCGRFRTGTKTVTEP